MPRSTYLTPVSRQTAQREHVPILEAKLAGDSCFEDSGEPLEVGVSPKQRPTARRRTATTLTSARPPAQVVLNSPERYAQKNLWNSCRRCGDGVREELAAPFRQQDNTPLSACKARRLPGVPSARPSRYAC